MHCFIFLWFFRKLFKKNLTYEKIKEVQFESEENMKKLNDLVDTIDLSDGCYKFYSLKKFGLRDNLVSKLPFTMRVILEAAIRKYDEGKVSEEHIYTIVDRSSKNKQEIPFTASRVILQDYTGVPLLADLASMRDAAVEYGGNKEMVNLSVPVDFVIDHSLQTNYTDRKDSALLNMNLEFERNKERYEFIKWGGQAFNSFNIVPPGLGIVHQINLEYLSKCIIKKDGVCFPDTVIGTDSHTTMVNGLGIVGWGVGGIEAEATMLGQPIFLPNPDIVGVNLVGSPRSGVTATDIVLTVTNILRKEGVVGCIVEFFGEGVVKLTVPDRATIANMAPEYGATMGFFGIDDNSINYLKETGRNEKHIEDVKVYYKMQGLYNINYNQVIFTKKITINLSEITPCVSGPKRPQDKIELQNIKASFSKLITSKVDIGGYEKSSFVNNGFVRDGDILLAAITSCTNTSNPNLLVAAGLVARNAVNKGLSIQPRIKRSLTPGSRVVTKYLKKIGLQKYFDELGFFTAGYGCATCTGNVGDLHESAEKYVVENEIIACSVSSGNRNFEARIHPNLRANFLMSPPLVIIFAIAGSVNINLEKEPIGKNSFGDQVFLKDIWPTPDEMAKYTGLAMDASMYMSTYNQGQESNHGLWDKVSAGREKVFNWNKESTYIAKPPFFDEIALKNKAIDDILSARALAIFGDSITTDHISPVGSIPLGSPAARYLISKGVKPKKFNSFGARRGCHEVMVRGAFSNVRLKNRMLKGVEGGFTINHMNHSSESIYDTGMEYKKNKVPSIIIAGQDYGGGSSRDWAAKATRLLGIKAVIALSFERIHRTNLIGMGVLPLQISQNNFEIYEQLTGYELFDILNIKNGINGQGEITFVVHTRSGKQEIIPLVSRLDTPTEVSYFKRGGILPYVLSEKLKSNYIEA